MPVKPERMTRTYQSPVDLLFSQLEEREPDHFAVQAVPQISSWRQVLYALKDFLIKRLGSLLEHTT